VLEAENRVDPLKISKKEKRSKGIGMVLGTRERTNRPHPSQKKKKGNGFVGRNSRVRKAIGYQRTSLHKDKLKKVQHSVTEGLRAVEKKSGALGVLLGGGGVGGVGGWLCVFGGVGGGVFLVWGGGVGCGWGVGGK